MTQAHLPICRHRSATLSPEQWICHSPKIVAPAGVVTSTACRCECPYVDHAPDRRLDRVQRQRFRIDAVVHPPTWPIRPSRVIPTNPDPKPTDPPIHAPVQFAGAPIRHLIYFIWPHLKSENWRWNVEQLRHRIELFNGVRSVGVATDPGTARLDDVRRAFHGVRIDHWIERPNDPQTGEGVCFLPLMETLPRDPHSVTYYGHAKGVRYDSQHITLRWAAMQYQVCLDHWSEVIRSLRLFPITGPFKRYSDFNLPGNWRWHYSGTNFWFRNADVFNRPDWSRLHPRFYGQVEAWPAGIFSAPEAGCLFGDDAQNLYTENEVSRWETALKSWPVDRMGSNGVSDRSFFEGEAPLRSRWNELTTLHARAAARIRELGCQTVLEIGSGLGAFLKSAADAGLDATGIDISDFQRDFALTKGVCPNRYQLADLSIHSISNAVDCVYCAEVFEHCPDAELIPMIRQIAAHCRWFLFTSTPHTAINDNSWGHINIKSREEWITLFTRYGLTFQRADDSLVEWGLLFRGQRSPTSKCES